METIKAFLDTLYHSPHYSYGWLVLAALSILPAIVSGNLVQSDIFNLISRKKSISEIIKPIILNISILTICISIIAYAFYLYVWVK